MSHCKIPRCPAPAVALGLCQKHYGRYRRHGTTELLRPVKKIQFKNYGAQLLYAAEQGNRLALARKIGLKHTSCRTTCTAGASRRSSAPMCWSSGRAYR